MSHHRCRETAILVVPRDRFSVFPRCLEALLACTDLPYRLVIVAGGADATTRRYLLGLARNARNVEVVLPDRLLSQIEARKLGIALVEKVHRYCVVLENDTIVRPGWLPPLLSCMHEEGAAAVMPLVYWHRGLHSAGCSIERKGRGRETVLDHEILYVGLHRKPIGYPESHCILLDLRRLEGIAVFDDVEPFDVDLGLTLEKYGLRAYLEPRSVVTYSAPPRWEIGDIAATKLRWDLRLWGQRNARFMAKWKVHYGRRRHKRLSYVRQAIKLGLAYFYATSTTVALANISVRAARHLTSWLRSARR
jgi:hypothetical protein